MLTKRSPLALFLAFIAIVQLACNLPSDSATPDTFATLNGLYTASAQTLESASTQPAFSPTPGLPLPTVATGGGSTAVPPANIPATKTPIPQVPAPVSRCDAAQFVGDVTYPDGSLLTRNSTFVKIWKIKNIGTCSWTTSYALVFTGGDAMSGPAAASLSKNVNPGESIEVPVTLTAPGVDGSYRGYWKLRNSSNVLFGIGTQADTAFWVDIKVGGPSFVAYDFTSNHCAATWETNNGSVACGVDGGIAGYALKLTAPVMEDGSTENEPGLLTVPQDKDNGFISGQYPAITVQTGDRFRTIVNCQHNTKNCNVYFRLNYKVNGQVKTLASWHEVYEGKYYPVDLDLSSLAGQSVNFILVVEANGPQDNDQALWLNPYIIRQGTPPTAAPTATFTSTPTATVTFTPTATATFTPTPTNTIAP